VAYSAHNPTHPPHLHFETKKTIQHFQRNRSTKDQSLREQDRLVGVIAMKWNDSTKRGVLVGGWFLPLSRSFRCCRCCCSCLLLLLLLPLSHGFSTSSTIGVYYHSRHQRHHYQHRSQPCLPVGSSSQWGLHISDDKTGSRWTKLRSSRMSRSTTSHSRRSIYHHRISSSSSQLLVLGDDEQDRDSSSMPISNSNSTSSLGSSKSSNNVATNTSTTAVATSSTILPTFVPSYRQLIVFTATTILIWISEPLLSLVDTTIVGMTAAATKAASSSSAAAVDVVVQLASLGPSTTLYDSAVYMTYFLAIATTNLISPALAKKQWKQLRKSTSHFMGLAMVCGSLVTTICLTMGRRIITNIVVGSSSTTAAMSTQQLQIIHLATQYASIRAMVAPFAVVDFCAQSFCLACLDTTTPAVAVAVASMVNIVGDWILIPYYGIQGAAMATAMATVSSCAILVRQVRRKTKEWKQYQEQDEYIKDGTFKLSTPTIPTTRVVDGAIEFLDPTPSIQDKDKQQETAANKNRRLNTPVKKARVNGALSLTTDIPFCSLPDRKSFLALVSLAGPIFIIMMLKIACYSIMTIQATRFGIIPLAAHNIMMRFFFFFACFGDSISQAIQTFFPQTTTPLLKTKLLKRLFVLSISVGLIISQTSHFILTRLGKYLVQDVGILETLATYAPYMASALFLHPLIMLMEGTILARRDLMILMGMYVFTVVVHCGWVLNGALTTNLAGLWQAFLGFQCLRLVQFTSRVVLWWWKTTRTSSSEPSTAEVVML
jgi:Na+-driven multidrug efflux pump